MRWGKLGHWLRHGISCADEEWDKRQDVIARLGDHGYSIQVVPNPCRLYARKEADEFIIDIMAEGKVYIMPVKWVQGYTDKSIIVTDIPDTGRYGIWDEESKYYNQVKELVKSVGEKAGEG